jgi:hypothetical protein
VVDSIVFDSIGAASTHELSRRRWLYRPGSKTSFFMALGPQVVMDS